MAQTMAAQSPAAAHQIQQQGLALQQQYFGLQHIAAPAPQGAYGGGGGPPASNFNQGYPGHPSQPSPYPAQGYPQAYGAQQTSYLPQAGTRSQGHVIFI
jgi:hypothetical protein